MVVPNWGSAQCLNTVHFCSSADSCAVPTPVWGLLYASTHSFHFNTGLGVTICQYSCNVRVNIGADTALVVLSTRPFLTYIEHPVDTSSEANHS